MHVLRERVLRAARVVRSVGLLRILTSLNRGFASLRATAVRRGLGYVLVAIALWWTAYTMTTGATSEPTTGEGKLLGWLLSLYGLAVFGYLTAALVTHFVGRERGSAEWRQPTVRPG